MTAQDDDWRLTGQEADLQGVVLRRLQYPTRANQPEWDHDHCEFCWAKFSMDPRIADALTAGYATLDEYYWICDGCFSDFRERFKWKLQA